MLGIRVSKRTIDSNKQNTIDVLEACQRDIEKEKMKANKLKETAINTFNYINFGNGGSGKSDDGASGKMIEDNKK